MPEWLNLADPLARKIVLASLGFIVVVLVVRIIGRRREAAAAARRQQELHDSFETVREQEEEIKRLADEIVTTSSTSRVTGFTVVRQVETVFTDGRASSVSALETCKALAAKKGANAIINLQTQQTPAGKWVSSGDAVVVRSLAVKKPKEG